MPNPPDILKTRQEFADSAEWLAYAEGLSFVSYNKTIEASLAEEEGVFKRVHRLNPGGQLIVYRGEYGLAFIIRKNKDVSHADMCHIPCLWSGTLWSGTSKDVGVIGDYNDPVRKRIATAIKQAFDDQTAFADSTKVITDFLNTPSTYVVFTDTVFIPQRADGGGIEVVDQALTNLGFTRETEVKLEAGGTVSLLYDTSGGGYHGAVTMPIINNELVKRFSSRTVLAAETQEVVG